MILGFMTCVFIIMIAMIAFAVTGNYSILAIVPFTVGIVFIAVVIINSKKEDRSMWENGSGKVIDIITHIHGRSGRHYHPPRIIVEFMDKDGKMHRGCSQTFKKTDNKYPIGTEVNFKYKLNGNLLGREALANIYILNSGLKEVKGWPIIIGFSFLGILFMILSILMIFGIK